MCIELHCATLFCIIISCCVALLYWDLLDYIILFDFTHLVLRQYNKTIIVVAFCTNKKCVSEGNSIACFIKTQHQLLCYDDNNNYCVMLVVLQQYLNNYYVVCDTTMQTYNKSIS